MKPRMSAIADVALAEGAGSFQLDPERRQPDVLEPRIDLGRHFIGDLAVEGQGDVQLVPVVPAGARQALLAAFQGGGDLIGQFDGGEEADHGRALTPAGLCVQRCRIRLRVRVSIANYPHNARAPRASRKRRAIG